MSVESLDSKQAGLEEYLSFLFEGQEGYVYSPTKEYQEDGSPLWSSNFYEWPQEKTKLLQHIIEKAPRKEIYVAPALFNERDSHKPHVIGTQVVWIELDGQLPQSLGDLPEPSLKIQSSDEGHEHWYWKLDNWVTDIDWIENVNRALAYKLSADTSGWDANQVLRPPKTFNHKRNRSVNSISLNTWSFAQNVFDTIPKPSLPSSTFTESDVLNVQEIIAKYPWPLDAFRMFVKKDVPQGERSTRLMQLGYYGAEIGLNDREIFSILSVADNWWGKFKDRDDRIKRLNDIVSKARLKHPFNNNALNIRELPVFGAQDVLDAEIELTWAAEGLLESMGCGLVSARPGLGKTQISLQFAIHLALGVPWLRYNIEEPKTVGFFSLEMHLPGIKFFLGKMLSKMEPEMRKLLQKNLKIIPLGQAIEVMSPNNDRLIREFIEQYEANGLFFDSLGRTNQKDLTKDENIRALFDWDAGIRNRYKTFSWFVHHNRKATAENKKPKSLDDVFGNVYITASCSDVYTLWGADPLNKSIEFINVKHRYVEQEQPYLLERTNRLTFNEQSEVQYVVRQGTRHDDTGLITAGDIENDSDLEARGRPDSGTGVDF